MPVQSEGKSQKAKAGSARRHSDAFGDLDRNNRTAWMEKNRERYRSAVVRPFRGLLDELTPVVLKLDSRFDVVGRTGVNFSRINRDIRFAKDKTPYRPQMYLMFPPQGGKNRGPGELYVGVGKAQ